MKILFSRTGIKKLLMLAFLFVGFWIAMVLFHELGHLVISELLGSEGNVIYYGFWPWPHGRWFCQERPEHAWIASLAGGLTAALLLFIFFWLPARIKKKDPIEIAVSYPLIFNLFYAPSEVLYYYENYVLNHEPLEMFPWVLRYTVIVSGIVFLLLYAKRTISWLKE